MKIILNRKTEHAATLTEVLAAVVVLSISMSGLMAALANGFTTMQMTRENQRASQILMEQTEMIRLYSWDQISNPGFVRTQFTEVYDPNNPNGQGCTYTGRVTVASFPFETSYKTNMRQVTVTLTWQTKGITRTRSLVTSVSKDGIQNYFL